MKYLSLFILSLLLFSCSDDRLSENSVVESNIIQKNRTELDSWIRDSITIPYGIAVEYRWEGTVAQNIKNNYPANADKVKDVLRTIKYLWLDTYNLKNIGGEDFMLGKTPIKIYLYGNKNITPSGVELPFNANSVGAEMYIYDVNEFDPKNANKVFYLMRSVHHQFAKKLAEIIPYDRDTFLSISQSKYNSSISGEFASIVGDFSRKELYGLSPIANSEGFYTMYGMLSPENDFAEIISTTLTHTPPQITEAMNVAKTPAYSSEPSEQEKYNEEARQAYKAFTDKQAMVNEYFAKKLKINLTRMQLVSISRTNAYLRK